MPAVGELQVPGDIQRLLAPPPYADVPSTVPTLGQSTTQLALHLVLEVCNGALVQQHDEPSIHTACNANMIGIHILL